MPRREKNKKKVNFSDVNNSKLLAGTILSMIRSLQLLYVVFFELMLQ